MDLASLPTFLGVVLLISASPGPAMALILRRAALRGFRSSVFTVLGLELGLYLWALAAAAGFAALVAASEAAYTVLRIGGAVVLVVMGISAWRAAWREHSGSQPQVPVAAPRGSSWKAFAEGLVVQLANPKAAVFMIAFYPQFVPADEPLFATTAYLAVAQVAIETVLYLLIAAGAARAGALFRSPRVRRRLEAVSGTVLVGLGIRVAASGR